MTNEQIRLALYRIAQFCKGRANYASRRNQIGRAKIFLAVWQKSLDLRDIMR